VSDALLAGHWQDLLTTYPTLFVGFSGGLDSTVLLHCLAGQPALRGKLRAVHVHHGLSVNATAWQTHCQQFCDSLGVPLIARQVRFDCNANIEEGAREARYQVFSSLLADNDCLLLAHHYNDQAETLLLQLFRGAGIDGLAAMATVNTLGKGVVARPFLQHSRQTLEAYAHDYKLTWVEDESNQDRTFSRNYLRHEIIPLLQAKWPAVVSNLVRSAQHCQQAQTNLSALATMDCVQLDERLDTLDVAALKHLGYARLVNVLRVWLKNNDVRPPSANMINRLINEVMLATSDATPHVEWGGIVVRRYQQTLYVMKKEALLRFACCEWPLFPEPLQLGSHYLKASCTAEGLQVPVGCRVHVRFRRGGELFYWRGQTKQLKKLWQEWHVPPWQRDFIPLLYFDNELAVVVGFAVSDHYFGRHSDNTYHVELRFRTNSTIMT
jgi:tRNA(Ile)-lysidine synthase